MISLTLSGNAMDMPPTPRPATLGVASAETLAILGPESVWILATGPDTLFGPLTRAQAETLAAAVETLKAHRCPSNPWRSWMVVTIAALAFGLAKL